MQISRCWGKLVQAVQFAEWRTDRVNEFILEREAFVQKDVRYNELKLIVLSIQKHT